MIVGFIASKYKKCFYLPCQDPIDGADLVVMRGPIHQDVPPIVC